MRCRLCSTTRDESSLGGPSRLSGQRGTAGKGTSGLAETAVWGIPGGVSQRPSTQVRAAAGGGGAPPLALNAPRPHGI